MTDMEVRAILVTIMKAKKIFTTKIDLMEVSVNGSPLTVTELTVNGKRQVVISLTSSEHIAYAVCSRRTIQVECICHGAKCDSSQSDIHRD